VVYRFICTPQTIISCTKAIFRCYFVDLTGVFVYVALASKDSLFLDSMT
jgi:hypothetical protein